jgi:RNA polymerase sigma-70 factor (ECF subfamily)
MTASDTLAQRFEENRGHLRAVAYRMLGSASEADDAVQEAWLRLGRADAGGIENLRGWLTTVVARICLDMLRSRTSRREEPLGPHVPDPIESRSGGIDPEQEALLADSVGPALLVVLETLAPAERLAFVLHDLFGVSFDEIASIVGRSPAAARQLASRARRRVRGAAPTSSADVSRQREIVAAFLAASRNGDFGRLLALLDPDVVLRADDAAVAASTARRGRGAPRLAPEIRGAAAVADALAGTAQAAQLALIDGAAGAVWAPGGKPRAAFRFRIVDGKVVEIDIVSDAAHVGRLNVTLLDD